MNFNTKQVNVKDLDQPETQKTIVDALMYGSYAANRGYGMTHEQLMRIGIGNDSMKAVYESQVQQKSN